MLPLDLDDIDPLARHPARGRRSAAGTWPDPPSPAPSSTSQPPDLRTCGRRDLFLDTAAWGKGVAWINGFCLGRYWSRGPQRTLYVPAPVLRARQNELIVLELHAAACAAASFAAAPDLGHTEA